MRVCAGLHSLGAALQMTVPGGGEHFRGEAGTLQGLATGWAATLGIGRVQGWRATAAHCPGGRVSAREVDMCRCSVDHCRARVGVSVWARMGCKCIHALMSVTVHI